MADTKYLTINQIIVLIRDWVKEKLAELKNTITGTPEDTSDVLTLNGLNRKIEEVNITQLVLGETEQTAYRGDRGKIAFEHISRVDNPHNVTKEQIGLGNVENLDQSKAISSITRDGTTYTATHLDGTQSTFDQYSVELATEEDIDNVLYEKETK